MNEIKTHIKLILADDDKDDCLFFKEALEELSLVAAFTKVNDGEQLMQHLGTITENIPHVLFLEPEHATQKRV